MEAANVSAAETDPVSVTQSATQEATSRGFAGRHTKSFCEQNKFHFFSA